jgi:hypothetical protein
MKEGFKGNLGSPSWVGPSCKNSSCEIPARFLREYIPARFPARFLREYIPARFLREYIPARIYSCEIPARIPPARFLREFLLRKKEGGGQGEPWFPFSCEKKEEGFIL